MTVARIGPALPHGRATPVDGVGYDREPDAYGDPHARVNSGTERFPAAQLKLAFCHTGVAFPRRDTLGPLEPWR